MSIVTRNILLIIFSVGLGICGQLSMKHAMNQVGPIMFNSEALGLYAKAFTKPILWVGFMFYVVSSVSWITVLSRSPLSFAYPLVSVGYVLVVFLSWVLFDENVSLMRIIGVLVICTGVFLVSRS